MSFILKLSLLIFIAHGSLSEPLEKILKKLHGAGLENDGVSIGIPDPTAIVDDAQVYSRPCQGEEVKPTVTRAKVDHECSAKFPNSMRCARICRLEALRVIRHGEVNDKAWKAYLEYSYPTGLIHQLAPKLQGCSDLFEKGSSSASSADCKENEKFMKCIKTVVDDVCGKDPHHNHNG